MRKQRFGKILEPMRKERSRKILEPAPSGRKPCAQPLPALLHAYPPPECSVFKSSFLINIIQGYSSFGGSPIKNGSPEPRIPQINSGSLGDPHRIPSGSHSLFRQPAALIGDQLGHLNICCVMELYFFKSLVACNLMSSLLPGALCQGLPPSSGQIRSSNPPRSDSDRGEWCF